jgi:pilus assembly protein CpaB
MILLAVAGLCGLIAAFTATKVMEAKDDKPNEIPMEQVYVAAADIDLGELMTPASVRSEEWPQDKIPDGAVRSLEEMEDRRTLVRLFPGEPILNAKLIEKDKWQDATQAIPAGYRVVAVRVDATSAAANLIKPGHRVDVMVFLKGGRNGITETGTHTFLRDIKVFSVDDKLTYNPDDEDGPMTAKNISVLVKPEQAQKVSLASELGVIKLSLRRDDEQGDVIAGQTTLRDLLDGDNSREDSKPGPPSPGGITGFIEDMKGSGAGDSDSSSEWEMTILSPNGADQYVWQDKDKLPIKVGAAVPASASSDIGQIGEAGLAPDGVDIQAPASDFGGGAAEWLDSNPFDSLKSMGR